MAVTGDLDRYRKVATLGAGGMATVQLAEDTLLGRQVALKRVIAEGDPRNLSRLRREALTGASVSHQNLVAIYDVITSEQGDATIVMEYVQGETLADALRREGRIPPAEALRILRGVAAGLDTIHRRGIVHRDVKPANILLGIDGAVKLADLGIASVADRTKITTAGTLLGSFKYMAPEQLDGTDPIPAMDIYALGTVAYEMLSGQSARSEPNPLALAHAISTQEPPNLRDAWPDAPPAAAELLIRAMSRDPSERPRSAAALVAELTRALEPPRPAPAPMPTPAPTRTHATVPAPSRPAPVFVSPSSSGSPWRRRAPALAAAAALVAVIAVLIAIASSSSSGTPAHRSTARRTAAAAATKTHSHRPKAKATGAPATGSPAASTSTTAATAGSGASGATTTPAGSAGSGAPAAGSAAPGGDITPVSAVESFYHLAAAHDYAAAWALADPSFRSQLGSYAGFEGGQAGDRSITFDSARVLHESPDAATVAVSTTSVRTDGTQHCTGTVDVVRGASAGGWLLHQIGIGCR